MKKAILFLGFVFAGITAISQPTIVTPVPANPPGTTALRLPNGTTAHTSIRGHYLVRASEITIANGTQFTALGFSYTAGTNAVSSGNFIVYLENTSDNTNLKSTTWTTAIGSMSEVYNGTYTLPQGTTTANNVDFTLSAPFTYTGGAIYVAYEYIGNSFSDTAAVNRADNTGVSNILRMAASVTVTPPATVGTGTTFLPQTRFHYANPYTNDIIVETIGTSGLSGYENKYLTGGPVTISARIKNGSNVAHSNISVSLDVTGANPFQDTRTISLGSGDTTTLVFSGLSIANNGLQTYTVSVPADEVPANDSQSYSQTISCDTLGYNGHEVPFDAIGFNTGAGILGTRYVTPATAVSVKGVWVVIGSSAGNPGKTVNGTLLSSTGTILATSPAHVITAGDILNKVYFQFDDAVVLPANTTFYVGLRQTAGTPGYFPVATTLPEIAPAGTYASFALAGGAPTHYTDLGHFMMGYAFDGLTEISASVTGAVCEGTDVEYTASGSYDLFDFSVNGSGVQSTASNTYTYAPQDGDIILVNGEINGCISFSVSDTAEVNALPVVIASATDTLVCLGSSTTLTATGADVYTWNPGNLSGSSQTVSPLVNTTYTVTGTDANGCSADATVDIEVEVCISVEENGAALARIYPNPAIENVTIELSDLQGGAQLIIFNQVGQQVHSQTLTAQTSLVQVNLPSGSYYFRIISGNRVMQEKLLIQR